MNGLCLFAIFFVLVPFLASTISQTEAQGLTPYQSQIEASPNENFDYAAVQLWMPASPKKVRGVLCVVLHPLGRGGSTLAHPQPWIELARQENCGLMSISFAQADDSTRDWCRAEQGTGRALLASLSEIARQSGAPALSNCPLVVVGVCAAGQFAYHFAAFAPTHVASFVTIGGGKHNLSKFKTTATIPALLVLTPDRGPIPLQNLQALYVEGKSLSAPWQLDAESIAKYDAGLCSSRVISYLRQRLASLGEGDAISTASASVPDTGSNSWLPISICGSRLPFPIRFNPATVDVGTISSVAKINLQSLTLEALPYGSLNSVTAFSSDSAVQTLIRKDGPDRWRLDCSLNSETLPLGRFSIPIKLRFLAGNKRLLGGEKLTLSGLISGPVNWSPLSLNFGSVKAGETSTACLEISSTDGGLIRVEGVTSPYSWIKATTTVKAHSVVITCVDIAPSKIQTQEFAGYLRVKLKSPVRRIIRIFCFGTFANFDIAAPEQEE